MLDNDPKRTILLKIVKLTFFIKNISFLSNFYYTFVRPNFRIYEQ